MNSLALTEERTAIYWILDEKQSQFDHQRKVSVMKTGIGKLLVSRKEGKDIFFFFLPEGEDIFQRKSDMMHS